MPSTPDTPSARVRVRHLVGTGLRRSPAPLQHVLRKGSRRVLAALDAGAGRGPVEGEHALWTTPEVPLPDGLSFADIEAAMRSWAVNGEPPGHLDDYVTDSLLRFLHTWSLVRGDTGSALELGANPYFTTWLLDEHTGLDLSLANYYGSTGEKVETVSWLPAGASTRTTVERTCQMFNVEEDEFPYAAGSFDVVMFCEMIEHMLMDPLFTLRQIHRVLKPGGTMILTTPNVARLENVLRLVHGANLHDPYSGFGPYGRHNREFTRHELHRLLEFAGFEVDRSFTADGHYADESHWPLYNAVAPLVSSRSEDLGAYLFVRARAVRPPRKGLPSFLYRSRPEGEIVQFA